MCPIKTIDDNLTLNSAGNTVERNDDMSFLVYPEEDEVTYMIPVPKGGTPRDTSLTPIIIMIVNSIGLKKSRAILKVLLDPGSTKTMISHKALPREAQLLPLQQEKKVTTLAGTMKTKNLVNLRDIRLPEFDKSCQIEEQKALIF